MSGQDQLNALQSAGYSSAEITSYQADRSAALLNGGFSQEEVAQYWGEKPFDTGAVRDHFAQNLKKAGPQMSFGDYLDAGWQMSVTGLIKRQKMPDILTPQDAPMWGRIASLAAQTAGDLPAMLAGAWAGTEGGAAIGASGGAAVGSIVPVAGTAAGAATGAVAGGTLGGGYGAFALPAYLRRVLVDSYTKGAVKSASDFWSRTAAAFLDAHHAGEIGALTAGVGSVVGAAVAPIMSPVVARTTQAASEITTMVTAGKAVQGQLPEPRDFLDAAVLVGALHLSGMGADLAKDQASRIASKIGDTYAATGIRPDEVATDAVSDPTIRQDIASDNVEIPAKYAGAADASVLPPSPVDVDVSKAMQEQAPAVEGSTPNTLAIKPEEVPRGTSEEEPAAEPTGNTAQDQVLARIAMNPQSKKAATLNQVYTALVDDLHPLKQLTQLLAGEKPLEVTDDPYLLARLTRGSTGKADHFLEHSPFEFDTLKNVGEPLTKILEPMKEDLDGLRAYAVSKRAIELEARGVKTGVPLEAAQETVAQGKQYEGAFQKLKDYQTHTLEYLRDSGILSDEGFQKMQEANQDYVPFYRLMDEQGGPNGPGKGLSVRSPIKKIEGSTRQIVDPLESIIKNTYLYVQLAERNRALSALADLADSAGEAGEDVMMRVTSEARAVKDPEAVQFMKENGVESPEALQIFRPKTMGLRPDEIALYRDGEREVYQVSPDVATAVRALDQQTVGLAVRMMRAPARWLRAGTTLSPEFTARNFIRDQLTAFNLGDTGFQPVLDSIRGLGSLFSKDEDYQNFLKSGGANSAMVAIDRDYIEQNIFKLERDTGLMSKTWNVLKSPLEVLRATSEIVENSTRLGEYKRLTQGEDDPQSIMEGGMGAREVTLDFQRIGAQTRALNMIVAFWNAHVQGLDKTVRAFADKPMETALKLGVSVTLPSVLLWFNNKDDPRWGEIPRWQKDLFWIVMTKDHLYRIPKPMELGIIFGSLPERILEAYQGTNPRAFKDLGSSLFQAFTPSYVPTFMVPVLEQFANRSTFTGNPIIPSSMENVLPEYQYTDYTTESGKLLGKFAATMPGMKDNSLSSPAVIENYVRAWSGQLGMYALKLADQALISTGTIPDPVKPASTLADIPVIKSFVIRYPSSGAQSIQDFYDAYEKINTRLNTIKFLAHSGDVQSAVDLMKVQQSENDVFLLSGIKDALSTQTKYLRLVAKNPQITPDEKRQLIDGVYYMMIQSAKRGNQLMDQMTSKLKERGVSLEMPNLNPSPDPVRLTQ